MHSAIIWRRSTEHQHQLEGFGEVGELGKVGKVGKVGDRTRPSGRLRRNAMYRFMHKTGGRRYIPDF